MDIDPYLQLMVEKKGSDLFFSAGAPVKLKLEGTLNSIGKTRLTVDQVQSATLGIMDERTRTAFERDWEADFSIQREALSGRFRVNVFRQRGTPAMVLRYVPAHIPTFESLGLPAILGEMIMARNGLIAVVGATGSGKSTTIASMLEYRNEGRSGHILTIEDPIEFIFTNKRCIINQREVGHDTQSHRVALRAAMREAPDIILVGEMRDRETVEAALELCNTGHLCVSTLHANNANQAMDRIINMFPAEQHKQLLMELSMNIRGVVSQRLVVDVSGKRCAAMEVLIATPHICELIRNGAMADVRQAMRDSTARGMQTFDAALYELYAAGRITLDEALGNADSRTDLEARINFG